MQKLPDIAPIKRSSDKMIHSQPETRGGVKTSLPQTLVRETATQVVESVTKKHFGHGICLPEIKNGESVPVGGSIFSSEASTMLLCDIENISAMFSEIETQEKAIEKKDLSAWLQKAGIRIDIGLFAALFSFTKFYEESFGYNREKEFSQRRSEAYKNGDTTLSEILNLNCAECAELAVFSQAYLRHRGHDASYFGGDVLWRREQEFSEPHSFVVLQSGAQSLIFDPANPANTNQGLFPGVYLFEQNFVEAMPSDSKRFIEGISVYSPNKKAYYGVDDGTNVSTDTDII